MSSPHTPDLRAALTELVACKDLKEELAAVRPYHRTKEFENRKAQYERRQPLAWKAARDALERAPEPLTDERAAPDYAPHTLMQLKRLFVENTAESFNEAEKLIDAALLSREVK